jgi:N-acyl-D-amino-acid deacylase
MLDFVIRGGLVADGSGQPARRADVGIKDGKISELGDLTRVAAEKTVDAQGLVVSPGFIDVHTHSDVTILVDPKAESAVRQGVTTQAFPNCGSGLAPAVGDARKDVEERARAFGVTVDWSTVGEYYRRVAAARPSINVIPMVAQGTVRMAVMGYSKDKPSRTQLDQMKEHVDEGMQSGARGMCSGLRYVPSGYASVDELVDLAKVVKTYGGLYATHMRSEGDNGDWFESIDEALAIGRGSGVPVQISHMKAMGSEVWGKSDKALAQVDAARSRGVDVTVDQYPYTAARTTLFVLFPQWSQEGGVTAFLERLADQAQLERIRTAFSKTLAMRGGGSRVVISGFAPDPKIQGKTLAQVAEPTGSPEFETAVELLRRSAGRVFAVYHSMEDIDVERIFRQPYVMVASDGSAVATEGRLAAEGTHPRSFGCFPKVLEDLVRKRKLVPLEEAIRKMTTMPAERFGLADRGLLRAGWRADITVFDAERVADRATFERPAAYPEGIEYVFVNGQMVVDRGDHTGQQPGQVLLAGGIGGN